MHRSPLSLPLSPAALVPLWAMAPRSAPGACLQDFHSQLLQVRISALHQDLLSSPKKKKKLLARGPKVQMERICEHLDLTNNCNPWMSLRRRLCHLCAFVESDDNPAQKQKTRGNKKNKHQTNPLVLPGTGCSGGFGFGTSRRGGGERRGGARRCDPSSGCRSLMPPEGINQCVVCLQSTPRQIVLLLVFACVWGEIKRRGRLVSVFSWFSRQHCAMHAETSVWLCSTSRLHGSSCYWQAPARFYPTPPPLSSFSFFFFL